MTDTVPGPNEALAALTILEQMLDRTMDETGDLVVEFVAGFERIGDMEGLMNAYVAMSAVLTGFIWNGLDAGDKQRWRDGIARAREMFGAGR